MRQRPLELPAGTRQRLLLRALPTIRRAWAWVWSGLELELRWRWRWRWVGKGKQEFSPTPCPAPRFSVRLRLGLGLGLGLGYVVYSADRGPADERASAPGSRSPPDVRFCEHRPRATRQVAWPLRP
jgi:hypothetical protein